MSYLHVPAYLGTFGIYGIYGILLDLQSNWVGVSAAVVLINQILTQHRAEQIDKMVLLTALCCCAEKGMGCETRHGQESTPSSTSSTDTSSAHCRKTLTSDSEATFSLYRALTWSILMVRSPWIRNSQSCLYMVRKETKYCYFIRVQIHSLFFTARDPDAVAISDLFFPLASNLHVWIESSAERTRRRRTDDTQVSEKYGTSPSGLE